MKKHPNSSIRSIATKIFNTWKSFFLKEMAKQESHRQHDNNTNVRDLRVRLQGKVIAAMVLNQRAILASAQNADVTRKRIRERLVIALAKVASEMGDESLRREVEENCDPIRVALSIEYAMFEKIDKPAHQKDKIIQSILYNLCDPKNLYLRRNVLIGEITAESLINMSNAEMASDEMEDSVET